MVENGEPPLVSWRKNLKNDLGMDGMAYMLGDSLWKMWSNLESGWI